MAKRQQQHHRRPTTNRQTLLSFWTTCIAVALAFLVTLGSGCGGGASVVDALSISLNGNGNRLQQQVDQQQLTGSNEPMQTQQHQLQHIQDNNNGDEETPNYVMQKPTTELVPNSDEIFDDELKDNGVGETLSRNQLIFGQPVHGLNLIKRAPGGFVGMRGKKSSYNDDGLENGNENADDMVNDDEFGNLVLPWQKLHDTDDNIINWDEYVRPNARRYKKAPSVFYGVRGKKFSIGHGINPNGDAYRLQQFLQKLDEDNMRHMIMDDFVDSLVNEHADSQQNDMTKRAPIGFTGVRGKRVSLTEAGGDLSMEYVGKRGLGNTFVGVRGKKDVSHQTFKRSPLGGGSESSAASGPSGKRQRFLDFGNKFVAVRGKKYSYDENEDVATNDWTSMYQNNNNNGNVRSSGPSALSALDANRGAIHLLYGNSGKRAPSGFVGMRGKRPLISDDILTIN